MNIYPSEQSLKDIITDKTTSAIVVPISLTEQKEDLFNKSIAKIKELGTNELLNQVLAKLEVVHPDLMYGSAILVSTIWNRNDDIFLNDETWKARSTPLNTPFNNQHEEKDIIGHIIDNRCLDKDGKLIANNIEEVPLYFDIEVDFVVYQMIFKQVAKDIESNAPKGDKFVSMECRFANFDYGLIDPETNIIKIIARNEKTSFLTKYLRIYGGEGYYNNQKIGRVLRDFRFIGMGLVDKPANPTSEFTKLNNNTFASFDSIDNIENLTKVVLYMTKGSIMKIETLEEAQKVIADLLSQIETLKTESKKETDTLKAEVVKITAEKEQLNTEKTNDKTAADSKIQIAQTELENLKKQHETVVAELTAVKAELTTKTEELNKRDAEIKATQRLNQLKEVGFVVTDENREKMLKMSDDAFASVIDFAKQYKPVEKQNEIDDSKKAAEAAAKAKEELDKAEAEKKTDVTNTKGDDETAEQKLEKTAAKLIEVVRKSRKIK